MRHLSKQRFDALYKPSKSPKKSVLSTPKINLFNEYQQQEQRIGKYKFSKLCLLGEGYSSKVYKGYQIGHQTKPFAIKVVTVQNLTIKSRKHLQRQLEIHKHLNHKNIVKCHDIIKTPSYFYLILEYCPHGNLHDFIKNHNSVDQMRSMEIFSQICSGYKYLIQKSIIHRDLKPQNILRNGNIWKICDFGFSLKLQQQFYQDERNVGTPLYMPLQSLKDNRYSHKSDFFALGITLYKLVNGNTPWKCKNQNELLILMIKNPIQEIHNFKNQKINTFLAKCLSLKIQDRINKQEFLQFTQYINSKMLAQSSQNLLQSMNIQSSKTLSNSRYSTNQSQSVCNSQALDCEIINTSKLVSEFQKCRLLYYMLVNVKSFVFKDNQQSRQIFTIVLYKYLLKCMKMLDDAKANSFKLKQWQSYKNSDSFKNISEIIKKQKIFYEKEFVNYLKSIKITTIRFINNKFPQFMHHLPLNEVFYQKFIVYLKGLIVEMNQQLFQIISRKFQTDKTNDKILALSCLCKLYYQTVKIREQLKKAQSLNIPVLERKNNFINPNEDLQNLIKIQYLYNFQDSKLSKNYFMQLRKYIKSVSIQA